MKKIISGISVKIINTLSEKVLLTYVVNKNKITIRVFPKEIIEIEDNARILSRKAFDNDWLKILNTNTTEKIVSETEEDKMQKAKKDVEDYKNKR